MKLTRRGWACVFLMGLSLASAATTGNNLLYLTYSLLMGLLLVSAVLGRLNIKRLSAAAEWPERVFAGTEFTLGLSLRNEGHWASYAASGVERIEPGEAQRRSWRLRLGGRGRAKVRLSLESAWPFGLVLHRRAAVAEGLVLPRMREARSAAELKAEARPTGRPGLKKGRGGEELFGVRPHGPEDDARLINWKLTAKTGRPVVVEHATPHESKVTVRLAALDEDAIEEAASACRFHLDAGAEVRLITPAGDVGYGRGLPHLDKMLRHLAELGAPAPEAAAPEQAFKPDPVLLRRLLDVGAVLVYAAMFLIEEVSAGMLLAGAPLILSGMALRRKVSLPKALWTLASIGMLVFITLVDWRASGVTVANAHLLIYLMINRSWAELEERELPQSFLILFLAFFLISGLTISLWYFPFFIAYVVFAASWLTLAAGGRPAAGLAVMPPALAVAAVLFAVTPRSEGLRRINPFIDTGIDKLEMRKGSTIAFSEGVTLGFFGELKRSSSRALRVRPSGAPERPGPIRLRGAAYELFDGKRWNKGRVERRSVQWARRSGRRLDFPSTKPGPATVYDVTVFPMGLSNVFTVEAMGALEADDPVYYDHTDTAYFAQPYLAGTRYTLYSRRAPIGFSKPDLERFLRLPPDPDGKIAELAKQLGPDPQRIERYLRDGYSYSAFSDSADRSLADFLFKTQRGNCEYFASAMVVLLRHNNVAARLVTGFYSDDWNEYGRFYDVRQGSAHAWVEAWLPGHGWITFDPTPAQGAFSARADVWNRRLGRFFNAVQARWYANIIGYDQYVQRNTFRRLGLGVKAESLLPWVYRLVAAVTVLMGLAGLRRLRWRRAPQDFFAVAQEKLEKRGYKRDPSWTPREYAEHVPVPGLKELAELHYLDRYARALTTSQAARAKQLVRQLNG